jgi:pimeloyl-ACP methyl ester carboxylesterase
VASIPPVRSARVGEVSLAFQVFGSGDRDVVVIPPMAHNIELMWERPEFRRIFDGMGRYARVVHFDKRGTGASDRTALVPTMDERVDDTRAVMDAAGVDRCFIYGLSEGDPMAVLFAVTYPERVLGLVLHATAAAFIPADDTADQAGARRRALAHWLERRGTEETTTLPIYAPTATSDPSYRAWEPRFERHSASPAAMKELVDMWEGIDVHEALASISVPTLVVHRRDDVAVPVSSAREMAAAIPDARFVELDGLDHFAHIGDVDQWLAVVEAFVTGIATPTSQRHPRRQATTTEILTFGGFRVTRDGVEVALAAWGSRPPPHPNQRSAPSHSPRPVRVSRR